MSDLKNRIIRVRAEAEELNEPVRSVILEIIDIISKFYKEPFLTEKAPLHRFIEEKKLKSHTENIVGMAYYLYKFEDVDPFNVNDIKRMYDEIRIPLPKNLSDAIAKTGNKNFFIEVGTKDGLKAWKISIEGIKFIEEREVKLKKK